MLKHILIGLSIIALSYILTSFVRMIAIKKSILDIPNDRSSHSIPTPRGGGLAIVVLWFPILYALHLYHLIDTKLFYALFSGLLVAGISYLDDIYQLSSKLRMVFHIATASLGLFFLGGIEPITIFGLNIENIYFLNVFGIFFIIWFINLFNFLDGIDGYITSEGLFFALSFFYLTNNNLFLLFACCLIGFLIQNWQPAKIFMGDIGSTLIGYTISILILYNHNIEEVSLYIGLILTSIFWFDATYTIFRRVIRKENIGEAHKKHGYQRLVQSGFSHSKTSLYTLLLNIVLFFIAIIALKYTDYQEIILILVILLLKGITKVIDKKKPF